MGHENGSDEMILVPRAELLAWAQDWLRENDPGDDTDVVTPFDTYLLKPPVNAQSTVHVEVLRHMKGTIKAIMPSEVAALDAATAALSAPQPPAEAQTAEKESDGEILNRLGDDAQKWAQEFRKTAIQLGYSDMDEGWLIGWFANAIEHSSDVRRWRKEAQPPSAPVGVEAVEDALQKWLDWCYDHDEAPDPRSGARLALEALYKPRLEAKKEVQQPAAAGEEIMVNAAHDVYTLPLQPSGLSSGPRFVVHVPAPEQQPAAPVLAKHQPCGCVICTCEDEQQCQGCGAKHCGNRADHPPYAVQQPAAVGGAIAWVRLSGSQGEPPGAMTVTAELRDGREIVLIRDNGNEIDHAVNLSAALAAQQPAAVDDTRRLEYLIDNELLVHRLSDTGLWMVTTGDLTPAIDGSEYDTWREAIDAALAAQQGGDTDD